MSYSLRDSTLTRNNYDGSSGHNLNPSQASKTYGLLDDIPDYGSAFVCGKSRFESEKFHVKNDPIVELSCGDEHTGLVTVTGRVFMFGSNNWGQLGLGHENNVDKPSCIKSLKHEKSILIACGRNHTIIATEKGNLYTFGCNSESQLGLGEKNNSSFYNSPQKIDSINRSEYWRAISAGAGQSCALTERGDLYVWGINDNGEIGIGKQIEQFIPKHLDLGFPIIAVSCGYYHTAIISKRGELYTTGSDEYFQLGHQKPDKKFHMIDKVKEPISTVACGAGHTIFATEDGYVYALGDGSKGQLGLGTEYLTAKSPRLINTLERHIIKQLSSGECHTAFVSDKGQLFSCGDNRYGKLGLSQKTFNSIQYTPIIVDKYQQLDVKNVACGGCHMILMGTISKLNSSRLAEKNSDDENYMHNKGKNSNGYSMSSARKENENMLSSKRSNLPDLHGKSSRQDPPNPPKKFSSRKFSDSGSDMDDKEAEFTFNRTHTLTRDSGFVPLSETNLRRAAEESMSKFGSHKTKNEHLPSSSRRYNDDYPDKKTALKKSSYDSDSDDEFLFNRKKFYNTKQGENQRSFSPLNSRQPMSSRETGYSVKPYGGGLKPYGTSKNRLSEESDEERTNGRGYTSERNRRKNSFNSSLKKPNNFSNSSTNVKNFQVIPYTNNDLRHQKADELQQTEQVSTSCFQKKPKEENDSRNRVDRYDDRHDEYDREKPKKSDKIRTCSIL